MKRPGGRPKPSGTLLGPSWVVLGPSWGRLGTPLEYLGKSWGAPGGILGHSWGKPGMSSENPGRVLRCPGRVLGVSTAVPSRARGRGHTFGVSCCARYRGTSPCGFYLYISLPLGGTLWRKRPPFLCFESLELPCSVFLGFRAR